MKRTRDDNEDEQPAVEQQQQDPVDTKRSRTAQEKSPEDTQARTSPAATQPSNPGFQGLFGAAPAAKGAQPAAPSFPGLLGGGGKVPNLSFGSKPAGGSGTKFGGLTFLTKPLASLVSPKKTHFWEIKLKGDLTTTRTGETSQLGESEDKKHDSEDAAKAYADKLIQKHTDDGWTKEESKSLFGGVSTETKPLQSLFGSFSESKPAAPEAVASGSTLSAQEQDSLAASARESFSNFKMPSFGAAPEKGLGNMPAGMSFGAGTATDPKNVVPSGFTSLFGAASEDGSTQEGLQSFLDSAAGEGASLAETMKEADPTALGSPSAAKAINLPAVEVVSGEESEERLLQVKDAKLFVFRQPESSEGSASWKEIGRGTLNVNKNPETKQVRLVMRRSETKQLVLNAALWDGMPYKFVNEKEVRISCAGLGGEIQQHLIKVMGDATGSKKLDHVLTQAISASS